MKMTLAAFSGCLCACLLVFYIAGCLAPSEGGPDPYDLGRMAAVGYLAVEPSLEAEERAAVEAAWAGWNALGDALAEPDPALPELLRRELRTHTETDGQYALACEISANLLLEVGRVLRTCPEAGERRRIVAEFRRGIGDALAAYRLPEPAAPD